MFRQRCHRGCLICRESSPAGLHVSFLVSAGGAVEGVVTCSDDKEGYAGHVHGGVLATLLDAAMTNCLFSHAVEAVTGELTVRLLLPVRTGVPIMARAWLDRNRSPLFYTASKLYQGGNTVAKAIGKFVQKRSQSTVLKNAESGEQK
jgi:acyl-coenzyme A thioesterase PaaI-like protein